MDRIKNTDSFCNEVRLKKAGSIWPVKPLKDKFLQITNSCGENIEREGEEKHI